MKTHKLHAFLLSAVLFCSSPAFAQMQQVVPDNAPIKIFKAQKAQPSTNELKLAAPASAPLSNTQLRMTVTQLQKKLKTRSTQGTGNAINTVTLTPSKPVAGNNFFGLKDGSFTSMFDVARITSQSSFFDFYFETIPNKTYLVDFTVHTDKTWVILGSISGQSNSPNGHLLFAFTATHTSTNIKIKPADNQSAFFSQAQLMQID